MTNFPASLDTFQNPSAATTMDAAGFEHDAQHANANDALAALQAKVGVDGSGDADSLDYLVAQINALLFPAGGNCTAKLAVSGGQVVLALWDNTLAQYYPLVLNNGVLGIGAHL